MTSTRAALVALAFTLLAPLAAHGWCRTRTGDAAPEGECQTDGALLQWHSVCAGFSLFTQTAVDVSVDDWRREATTAAARWHNVACDANGTQQPWFQLLPFDDTTNPTGYNSRGTNSNTVSFNPVWSPDPHHRAGTIAITIVTFDTRTGEIVDADLELNQRSADNPDGFHFTTGTPDFDSADLPTILTHEFGHFQGMAHSPMDSAVMWAYAGLGEQRRNLTVDDVGGICNAYAPGTALDMVCTTVPYGGFARTPSTGRVQGGCAVTVGAGSTRNAADEGRLALGFTLASLALGSAWSRRRARAKRRENRAESSSVDVSG